MPTGSSPRASQVGPRHRHFVIATWAISPPSAAAPRWVKLGRLELTGLPRKYRPFLHTRFRQPSGP